jgi:ABC-type nitrate/sulfonate/bicarbonate transport system ATPase subunit
VSPPTEHWLSLRDVSLSRRGLRLVSDLWLDVSPGEVVAVMGRSGVGKTTLLRAIAGLTSDVEGVIARPSGRVGVVFQDPRLLPWRTALQNVELVCGGAEGDRARRWLDAVGLADAVDLYPAQLSGGMRQRVAVARALAHDAPVVLVDEPFASLDSTTATTLRDELVAHLGEVRRAVMWVTHDQREADAVAGRTLVLAGPPTGSWRLHGTDPAMEEAL